MYGQQFTPKSRILSLGGGDQDRGATEEGGELTSEVWGSTEEGLGASEEGRRATLEETAGEGEVVSKELSLTEDGGDSTEEVEEGGDSLKESGGAM